MVLQVRQSVIYQKVDKGGRDFLVVTEAPKRHPMGTNGLVRIKGRNVYECFDELGWDAAPRCGFSGTPSETLAVSPGRRTLSGSMTLLKHQWLANPMCGF
jgi:hypothetical protein